MTFTQNWYTLLYRPGTTRGRAPEITACAPRARIAPQRKLTAWCHLSAFWGLCPPSVSKLSFQDEMHDWTSAEDLFLVSTFVGKNRDPHHKIPSLTARLWRSPPLKTRIVTRKEANGLKPRSVTWGENFFLVCILPNLREKFICATQIFFLPPSCHATLAPGCAYILRTALKFIKSANCVSPQK